MKMLILGSNGALGGVLSDLFRHHKPKSWDRQEVDLTNHLTTEKQITEFRPELVFNCAAYNDLDKAESEPEKAEAVNGYAVGNLAKVCKDIGATLVHFSTNYVFDGAKQGGYNEEDSPNPSSAYARSKLLGEKELMKNCDRFFLVRTAMLFGGKPGAGGKKSFVEKFLEISRNKKQVNMVSDEAGNPTYVKDLALAVQRLVEGGLPFGIYHLTNSGAATWFDWAKEIARIKKMDIELVPVSGDEFSRPAKRPHFATLNNTKTAPLRRWQEALREYLAS